MLIGCFVPNRAGRLFSKRAGKTRITPVECPTEMDLLRTLSVGGKIRLGTL